MNFISNNSIKIFLGLLLAVILFHICVLIKVIPYDVAWGGRLQNDNEMYVFESISIFIIVFLTSVLLMKGNHTKFKFSTKTVHIILWVFFGLFVLNTFGNLFAKTIFEKFFAVLTGLFAILIWKIQHQEKTTKR